MYQIIFLDENDIINPTDYCRPLELSYSFAQSDSIITRSTYSGSPINNLKWVLVSQVLGEVWFGKTYKEFLKGSTTKYEYVRGNIPEKHILKDDRE